MTAAFGPKIIGPKPKFFTVQQHLFNSVIPSQRYWYYQQKIIYKSNLLFTEEDQQFPFWKGNIFTENFPPKISN